MIRSSARPLLPLAALACGSLLYACGGAADRAPASPASQAAAPAEPETIDEARAQIEAARSKLTGAPGPAGAPASPGAAASDTVKTEVSPDGPTKAGQERKAAEPGAAADRCQSPCRAIASMRRAVIALCRMTGDDDPRCGDARRTLRESETRVAPCGC